MKSAISIYYTDHRKLNPHSFQDSATDALPPLFSDLFYGEGGTMKRSGQQLSPKYVTRKYASFLLMHKVLGVCTKEELVFGSHGKPSLKNHPDCFFNLSHGRDYSVLAVSDQPLGIDIEEIPLEVTEQKKAKGLKKRQLVATRSFPASFLEEYLLADSDFEAAVFTRLWTQFEAVLKAEGTGLSLSLKDHPELLKKWTLKSFSLGDHIITLALEEDFSPAVPVEVDDFIF